MKIKVTFHVPSMDSEITKVVRPRDLVRTIKFYLYHPSSRISQFVYKGSSELWVTIEPDVGYRPTNWIYQLTIARMIRHFELDKHNRLSKVGLYIAP